MRTFAGKTHLRVASHLQSTSTVSCDHMSVYNIRSLHAYTKISSITRPGSSAGRRVSVLASARLTAVASAIRRHATVVLRHVRAQRDVGNETADALAKAAMRDGDFDNDCMRRLAKRLSEKLVEM